MILKKLLLSTMLRHKILSTGKIRSFYAPCLFLFPFIFCLAFPAISGAELVWKEKTKLKLDVSPLDIVQSDDGQWTFILSSDAVLVYSVAEGKVMQNIPLDEGFDSLSYAGKSRRLILTSKSRNMMKVILLDVVHKIDVTGMPFMGAENATVTIAVFSDYQ
ncbi:MAG: hypothetical protein V1764_06100 [Nitrospirota bacterium]